MVTAVRSAILEDARGRKQRLRSLLLKSPMTAGLDPEEVIRVLDPLLNVPREDVEEMLNLARQIAGARRELPRWS